MGVAVLAFMIFFHHLVAKSVIMIIREYNSKAEEMLTFLLSSVKAEDYGFGEADGLSERSPLLKTKSVMVGTSLVLSELFNIHEMRAAEAGEKPNPNAKTIWVKIKIKYLCANNKQLAESDDKPVRLLDFFSEKSNQAKNAVVMVQKEFLLLCYQNGIVRGRPIAFVFLQDSIQDFHLSTESGVLFISKKPVYADSRTQLDTVANSDRGSKVNGPVKTTAQSEYFTVREAKEIEVTTSEQRTESPGNDAVNPAIDGLIDPSVELGRALPWPNRYPGQTR